MMRYYLVVYKTSAIVGRQNYHFSGEILVSAKDRPDALRQFKLKSPDATILSCCRKKALEK